MTLPKEMMSAVEHGIRTVARTNWITKAQMQAYHWSASSQATSNAQRSWFADMEMGAIAAGNKQMTYNVTCVR